jgi:sulfur-oxidizing protein SoxX
VQSLKKFALVIVAAVFVSLSVALAVRVVSAANVTDAGLVPYTADAGAIAQPLTSVPGDPENGKKVALDRKLGNCVTCHAMPVAAADQGNIGPDLRGVASRSTAGQLRLRVVNPKLLNPYTIMPAYYRVDGLQDVGKAFAGQPILNAQQVEDVVAFLETFK